MPGVESESPGSAAAGGDAMDHQTLDEHQILERYLLGQLPPEQAAWLEEHTLYCDRCRERLETTEALLDGLRTVAGEDATAVRRLGIIAWLARRSRAALLAGVAALLAAVAAPSVLLWQRAAQVGSDLAAARRPGPAAVLSLAAVRGGGAAEPSHRLALGDRSGRVVLSLELAEVSAERYAVTLSDQEGRELWSVRDLVPDHRDALPLVFPASTLAPGVYRLRVDAQPADPAGEPAVAGRYAFRAVD